MLTRAELDRFLRLLAEAVQAPATIVLTGGCEAMLLGGVRPTADVDFEVASAAPAAIESAIAVAAERSGIAVQWSADIDRWSAVSIPASRRRTRPYRRLGRLRVRMLAPDCWAVYKLARYLESDVEDLRAVLRRQRVDPLGLARLSGASLRASPRSTSLFQFRRQVEDFFRHHGAGVWGRSFDAEAAVRAFHRAAGIRVLRSKRSA